VRHKVLDTIGDLYTAGGPIIGRFVGRRAGHTLHNQLLRALFADPEGVAWGVALPLLLMIAGGAYLLLQRLIDGGQKLAWRGRGRPDDAVVEF